KRRGEAAWSAQIRNADRSIDQGERRADSYQPEHPASDAGAASLERAGPQRGPKHRKGRAQLW
ncbi:MAG: hypothetical protein AAGK22_13920, partial [Acidobacteriota bacterium]